MKAIGWAAMNHDNLTDASLFPADLGGPSAVMAHVRNQIRRVAPYYRTAMLIGERHCGDAAAAALLHRLSPLADRPLITLNAADAESMLGEAFSPAVGTEAGMLFLTWPERLSRSAQSTLLRVLRNRRTLPPRVVLFAEHGLRPLVSAGTFSAELESSLGALRITLPSLRNRAEDIPFLLTHKLIDAATRSGTAVPQTEPTLLEAATSHLWPGNLQQLAAVANFLIERSTSAPLKEDDLLTALGALPADTAADTRPTRLVTLDQVVQEHLRSVLLACNGNKLRTAEVLGISRSTLYRMLETNSASPMPFPLDTQKERLTAVF